MANNGIRPIIYISDSTDEKERTIKLCDDAFEHPLTEEANYKELFCKIDSGADFIIAKSDSVLGYVAMYTNKPELGFAYITLLVVRPQYQRNHVGKFLVRECETIALRKGIKKIRLEVRKNNKKAIQFYLKMGFSKQEEKENTFYLEKTL